jgi:hypothetical protein
LAPASCKSALSTQAMQCIGHFPTSHPNNNTDCCNQQSRWPSSFPSSFFAAVLCFLSCLVASLAALSPIEAVTSRGWLGSGQQNSHQLSAFQTASLAFLALLTMASKLCCTADQESRSGSPDLPNARVSAATSNQPLLSKDTGSPSSHFTSARSEELHELRQIFEDAQDESPHKTSPLRRPRPHSSRRSIYSLHSLHKMTSMRSLLRRKFSKDLPRKKSNASTRQHAEREAIKEEPDTIAKHANVDKKHKLKVTKDDLRKDLLSDKDPVEGGYDSDAEVLDVVARNIGKSTPTKRPSIHSVEWAPSSGGLVSSNTLQRRLLTFAVNQLQAHPSSDRSASNSKATFSPTRSRRLNLSQVVSDRSSARRIFVLMG